MFRSLGFRLPALFLAAIVLSGLIATLIAVKLFQDYTRDRKFKELRREAAGLAQLYAEEANHRTFAWKSLELATGDRLFYSGLTLFPGLKAPLKRLPEREIRDWDAIQDGHVVRFTFTPPRSGASLYAVAQPVKLGRATFGALVVATPTSQLRAGWLRLIERLSLALIGGIVIAGALGWYLSRRITRPVLALSRAADELAKGRYDVAVPDVKAHDEIGALARSFHRMARRLEEADELERNFLLTVSHELRTPLTAILGHVEALREGVASDPAAQRASRDVVAVQGARLERLGGDILDLAKLNGRRFTLLHEEVDMAGLVEQAYS